MRYEQDAINQAREYRKFINHDEIVNLVRNINTNNLNYDSIKQMLTDCFNNFIQKLPVQNDTLSQNVFNAFCMMVKNNETHIIRYGIIYINGKKIKTTIPKIDAIAKIAVDEWIQEYENKTKLAIESGITKVNDNATMQKPESTKAQREINSEKLKHYFKPQFKGMGNGNINYFDLLIKELKTDRNSKEFGQIALMIYECGKMNDRRPNTFSEWYKIFCECINCEQKKYNPGKLQNPKCTLRNLFNYLQ